MLTALAGPHSKLGMQPWYTGDPYTSKGARVRRALLRDQFRKAVLVPAQVPKVSKGERGETSKEWAELTRVLELLLALRFGRPWKLRHRS